MGRQFGPLSPIMCDGKHAVVEMFVVSLYIAQRIAVGGGEGSLRCQLEVASLCFVPAGGAAG